MLGGDVVVAWNDSGSLDANAHFTGYGHSATGGNGCFVVVGADHAVHVSTTAAPVPAGAAATTGSTCAAPPTSA